ncbi:cupin domain-containing protein [Sphingomonas montana]|uniref:cupin domain-containing protein n=1 Tax=Sphingomonas montana TaxID=1843236 RepID=UPI0013EC8BF3|nr:cupin domain-containing protein [Sphingomonas montana]
MDRLTKGWSVGHRTMIAAAVLAIGSGTHALAQGGGSDIKGIVWTELQKLPLASDPSKEESIGIAVIQPSAPAERHSHAENEIGYVLAGASLLEVEGEPTRTIRTGDSFAIPAGRVHRAKPVGKVPLKVVVTYIVERGQPLARPAR